MQRWSWVVRTERICNESVTAKYPGVRLGDRWNSTACHPYEIQTGYFANTGLGRFAAAPICNTSRCTSDLQRGRRLSLFRPTKPDLREVFATPITHFKERTLPFSTNVKAISSYKLQNMYNSGHFLLDATLLQYGAFMSPFNKPKAENKRWLSSKMKNSLYDTTTSKYEEYNWFIRRHQNTVIWCLLNSASFW